MFVDVEGWLETLGGAAEGDLDPLDQEDVEGQQNETWIPFWFALMTKEYKGLVDSRSLQYSTSPDEELPEHAIPLPVARTLEPCVLDENGQFEPNLTILRLEARDCEFTLTIPPPLHAPSVEERVYSFKGPDATTAAGWVQALREESDASPFRLSVKSPEEISFLAAAYRWMEEVFSEHATHKLQVLRSVSIAFVYLETMHD